MQEQIVPRRDAASVLLRQLERANENSLTESEEQFSTTRRAALQRLLVLLGLGLLVGIMVTAFSLNYSENLEQQSAAHLAEVSRAKQDLEKLSARLMEIQEEERRRLSRELHDEIVQTLAVLKIWKSCRRRRSRIHDCRRFATIWHELAIWPSEQFGRCATLRCC